MKRAILRLIALCTLIGSGWGTRLASAAAPVPVVASFSILGDLVQVVGGDRVKVTTLAGRNADAHEFTPSPADARAVLQARLFVVNGLNFEPWAQKLARSANYKGDTVVASNGVPPRQTASAGARAHAQIDPHAWQNPQNVVQYVSNIAAALARVDPAAATIYRANAAAYGKQLQALDAQAKAKIDTVLSTRRKVITSHDAFGYLGEHYGITLLAAEGINTNSEPSAKHVAGLIRQIKREKIKAVFVENMSNPKLMTQLSKDAGVHVGATLYSDALSEASGPASTYLKMMDYNLTQLVAGMQLN